ncbi:replication factor C subunit 4 [Zootermopsis nevadensis]|uniref:Replication factor C subunit 2 n=1 Tax=Zootermopsis nevadensis TaxID=136037 RepID=A0A067RGL1_ZOONE|nr:replication factor C subunit 4 [Zootermopsis nevadensis]KDR22128.1 Replication factor C subunit 4 [Zootermopsis nevadensis]
MQAFLKTGKLSGGQGSSSSRKEKLGSTGVSKKKPSLTPWVEKYRPRTVNDVVEQNDVVEVMRQCLNGADLPNLLFYGPPGTGKTSTILAAARQLFGDIYKDRILELNASDERGIQVIREKVKNFAQFSASGVRLDGRPCPPFKIVILDEADSMTQAAQAALRRTMERETKTTRFCLVCNYVSRIIPPITSRCSKFRFKPLGNELISERLQLICSEEKVSCSEDAMKCLVETSGGDLRRAITCLQSCSRLKGSGSEICAEDVQEVAGVVPLEWVNRVLEVCRLNSYEMLTDFVDKLMEEGYCAGQLIEQLHEVIVFDNDLTDEQKAFICDKLGVCSFRMQDGGNEYIGLLDLGCTIIKTLKM